MPDDGTAPQGSGAGGAADPVQQLAAALLAKGYVADRPLATVLHLAEVLTVPVLLEGEPGVGKTSVAEALAAARGARLVRLQCYEGLSAHHALYEWDYARQLLEIRLAEAGGAGRDELESRVFDTRFLLRRPLLEAIWPYDDRPVLLLVDEVDRADEEFEALLLEVLSQYQVTIPEIGTVTATRRPTIVLTANRTRALSDALRRRCLYHWIPFPTLDREIEIVQRRLPDAAERLTRHACMFVQALRAGHYRKAPGVSETIDWMRAMTAMGTQELTAPGVVETLGCLLKDADDVRLFVERDSERVLGGLGLRAPGVVA
ncbi:MAG: AAA family ATPase [Nocardioidaceae bacterium]